MSPAISDDLVRRARAIGPLVAEHAADGERERRLPEATWEALRDAGFLRLYVPESLGGLEIDPLTCAGVTEEVSRSDSAAGWAVMVANAVAWWCRALPTAGPEEIYAQSPDAFVATAFHPPLGARRVDGGYRLTGRAPLASNVHAAPWLLVTALVAEEDQAGTPGGAGVAIAAVMRTEEAEIADTWHSMGMRATDSNDVTVADVFVPESRTFAFEPEFEPGAHYKGSLYRAPALGAALAPWSSVALSVARGAIDQVKHLAQRKTPFASATPLRERPSIQAKVGKAEALLRSARALLYGTLAAAWQRTLAGGVSSVEQKAELLMASVHAVQSAAAAVELAYGASGTSGIYTRSPLERHFRDIQVLRQHGFMSESRYETVGQVMLGLPPDLGLLVF